MRTFWASAIQSPSFRAGASVIHRTNDADDKLIVVPDGSDYSDEQIRASTDFVEQNFEFVIIRY